MEEAPRIPRPANPEIKICGLRRPEDIRLSTELGANYLGLIVYERSPRAVPREEIPERLSLIPGGKRVCVDVNTGTRELEQLGDLGFDFFQIHFDLEISLATVAAWSGIVGPERLWLVPRIPPGEPFPQMVLEFADTVLVDAFSTSAHGGTGKTADWQRFGDWSTLYGHKRWGLAGGLSPDNALEALAATQASLLDFNSGVERSPGHKDPEKLRRLFALFPEERPPASRD